MRICSFCGTREDRAGHLVVSDRGAAICEACAELATGLVAERETPIGDMLLTNIGQLVTNDPRFQGILGLVTDAVVAVRDGNVVWAGPSERLPQRLRSLPRLDCEGRAVIPGLVDAHTHLLFGGDRSREFELRAGGLPDEEAAARSGGRALTARSTRMMETDDLADLLRDRLDRMLEFGTTTAEASAGYSTGPEEELELLGIAREIARTHPMDLVPTLDVIRLPTMISFPSTDQEFRIDEVLPDVTALGYAVRVSVGRGSLLMEEARRLLSAAARLGVRTRIHRDTMTDEAYDLALDTGPSVVDHCGRLDRDRARAMALKRTPVVITPISGLADRLYRFSARELIELQVPVALGTDCSPAPMMVESLPLCISLAVAEMGLTPDQAVWAATRGSAYALGLRDRGWVGHGAIADLVILDAPSPSHISYRPGTNLVWRVLKNGAIVVGR